MQRHAPGTGRGGHRGRFWHAAVHGGQWLLLLLLLVLLLALLVLVVGCVGVVLKPQHAARSRHAGTIALSIVAVSTEGAAG